MSHHLLSLSVDSFLSSTPEKLEKMASLLLLVLLTLPHVISSYLRRWQQPLSAFSDVITVDVLPGKNIYKEDLFTKYFENVILLYKRRGGKGRMPLPGDNSQWFLMFLCIR